VITLWPFTDSWRSRFSSWRLLLLFMGAPVFVIGLIDLISAGDLEARALGLLLFIVGGLTCAAGIISDVSLKLVQLAATAGMVTGLFFFVAARPDLGMLWPTIACIGGLLGGCLCGIVAVQSSRRRASDAATAPTGDVGRPANASNGTGRSTSPRKPAGSSSRDVIVTSVATLAAAIVALVGTWYAASYVPAVTFPALNVTAEVEDISESADMLAVPIVVTAKNAGTRTLRLLQSYYQVHGLQVTPTADPVSRTAMEAPFLEGDYDGPVQRFSLGTTTTTNNVIQGGRAFEDGAGLVPNEEITSRVLVYVPKEWKNFQSLRVIVDIASVREDQVPLASEPSADPYINANVKCWEPISEEEDGQSVPCTEIETAWPVEQNSLLERIVRSPQCVYTGFDIYESPRLDLHGGIPEYPANYALVADQACGSEVSKREESEFWVSTVIEQSLWETRDAKDEAAKSKKP
jgi:hypothetical protein